MKKYIPNLVTMLNLVFGMFAILATLDGNYDCAVWCIICATIADGMDGRVARYLNETSELGKELDSLCDLVSFGVAPAVLAYSFQLHEYGWIGYLVAAFFAACGAFRLARFNVNTDVVKGYFMGVPIPAGGCVLASFIYMGIHLDAWMFLALVILFGYLMVSTVKYPDFKGKGETFGKVPAVIAALVGLYILVTYSNSILFVVFFTYILFGLLNLGFSAFKK
ncbi:MAG: CDP-diacylglycerol--serine O-phosphatidyltransferase [Selenomonadales bacterium]|nr:CDP-diacylglycerol--serine O-phosphatidyltransferase [Selenomonadales bacterium]